MTRESWRDAARAWLYALPALTLIGLVSVLPIGETVHLASGWSWLPKDPRLMPVMATTLKFTFATVSIELLLGLGAALLLARPFRGRGPVRAAALLPWALPTAVMAMAWRWIYNPDYGVFGDLLHRLHLISSAHVAWLARPASAFWACVLADVWKTTPFIAILLMSALAGIPEELYEAASIDGAGPVRRFFLITLPALKPTILVAVLFRAIQSFGIFDLIWVLTGGGPAGTTQTIALYVYDVVFRYQELGYGCALTLVMAAALAALAGLILLAGRLWEDA